MSILKSHPYDARDLPHVYLRSKPVTRLHLSRGSIIVTNLAVSPTANSPQREYFTTSILDSLRIRYTSGKPLSPRRHILPRDLRPHRRLLHPVVLAHAGEHGEQSSVRLLGGEPELGELLAMRILNVLSLRQHRADDRRHIDH